MNTPTSVVIGVVLWLLAAVIAVLDSTLAHLLTNVTAGAMMGMTFTVLAWYAQQEVVQSQNASIKIMVARNTAWSHIIYSILVFLTGGIAGTGTVFGIQFVESALALTAIVGIGAVIGVFMYFAQELDAGFRADGGSLFWFPVILSSMLLGLLFFIIAAGGGWLFATALIGSRFLLGYTIHHRFAYVFDALLEDNSLPLVILNLMTLPVLAYISTMTI